MIDNKLFEIYEIKQDTDSVEYKNLVEIVELMDTFIKESKKGYDKQNKSSQARARKASNLLTKSLKIYRDITLGRLNK